MDTSVPEKEVHFEDLLSLAGNTGRWQVLLISCLGFFYFTVGYNAFSMIFLGETPDFFCADGNSTNTTFASLSETAERCSAPDGEPCRRWMYDPAMVGSSVVTQWDLVCERRPLLSTIQSVMYLGSLFGAVAAGAFGDRLGRRTVILAMLAMYVTGTMLSSVPAYYDLLLLGRFLLGFGWLGTVNSGLVLIIELTGLRWRAWAGQLAMLPMPLGEMLLSAVAYKMRVWWQLQLTLAVPVLIFVLSFWVVPESPRWLILRGRDAEALQVLATAARVNGRQLPEEAQLQAMLKDMRRCELAAGKAAAGNRGCTDASELWRSPRLSRWMLATCVSSMAVCAGYFGISFDMAQLSESPYLACTLSGLVEVPTHFLPPLMDRIGRRPIASTTCFLAGVSMIGMHIAGDPTLRLVIGLVGKLFISCTYNMINVYTSEYIPTSVRGVGFGIALMCSRIGGMAAPYIVDLAHELHHAAPSVVFGSSCVLASLMMLLLPETAGRQLPETAAELEAGVLDQPDDKKAAGESAGRGRKTVESTNGDAQHQSAL